MALWFRNGEPYLTWKFVHRARSVLFGVYGLALDFLEDPKGKGLKQLPDVGLTEFEGQGRWIARSLEK